MIWYKEFNSIQIISNSLKIHWKGNELRKSTSEIGYTKFYDRKLVRSLKISHGHQDCCYCSQQFKTMYWTVNCRCRKYKKISYRFEQHRISQQRKRSYQFRVNKKYRFILSFSLLYYKRTVDCLVVVLSDDTVKNKIFSEIVILAKSKQTLVVLVHPDDVLQFPSEKEIKVLHVDVQHIFDSIAVPLSVYWRVLENNFG